MPFDMITIGSAVVDIFITSKDFSIEDTEKGLFLCQRYGDKVELDRFELHTGGGGSNTAVGFSKMGFSTAVVCELGQDMWTQFVVSDLTSNKVDTSLLIQERKEQTGGSIILTGTDGGRTVMVHRGAASMLDPQDLPVTQISQAKWIHLTNIAGRINTLKTLFNLVSQNSIRMSWNPGKSELRLLADGQLSLENIPVEVLIVNDQEWAIVTDIQQQIKEKIKVVVVTEGRNGGKLYYQNNQIEYKLEEAKAIEETGAGDAFGVGFISAYIFGKDLPVCLDWGKKNAASVVQKVGAKNGLLSQTEIEQV